VSVAELRSGGEVRTPLVLTVADLKKMLSGANAFEIFEISDIERMNIGAHQPGVWHVTMLHAL
jgi:hypothetical protein